MHIFWSYAQALLKENPKTIGSHACLACKEKRTYIHQWKEDRMLEWGQLFPSYIRWPEETLSRTKRRPKEREEVNNFRGKDLLGTRRGEHDALGVLTLGIQVRTSHQKSADRIVGHYGEVRVVLTDSVHNQEYTVNLTMKALAVLPWLGDRRQGRNQQASYSYCNGLDKRIWLGYKSKSGQALNGVGREGQRHKRKVSSACETGPGWRPAGTRKQPSPDLSEVPPHCLAVANYYLEKAEDRARERRSGWTLPEWGGSSQSWSGVAAGVVAEEGRRLG